MSFPRYERYKDSGVEWLGEVPEHWEVCALNYRFQVELGKMLDEKRITGEHLAPYLRNTDVQWGEININDLPEMDFHGDDLARYALKTGDLLVCEGGDVGRAAIWRGEIDGCYYQKALHRLRARKHAVDAAEFFYFVLYSAALRGVFSESGKSTIAHLTAEAFRRYRFPFPPYAEQTTIATFLDRETAKIDALIAEQQRLIELLKEKRQAVISHAVTKGLNPDALMRDSGIEWLGEVPEHWEVKRLKNISPQITVGIVVEPSKYYVDEGVPALRSLNVKPCSIALGNLVYISQEANILLSKSQLRAGDLVAVRSGQPGTTAVIPNEIDGCNCIDLIIIRKPFSGSENFLCWFLNSDGALQQFSEGSGGAIQQHFNIGTAMTLIIPTPPKEEQKSIAAFLDRETAKLDALTAEAQTAITLLQERRTALISAAVIGQIDVRGFASDSTH